MQIELSTDGNIDGSDALATQIDEVVKNALSRFSDQITRVEVHLSDQNSDKKEGDDDMRCMMEARLEGHQPIAVTDEAESIGPAIDGVAKKVKRSLDHTLGRLSDS